MRIAVIGKGNVGGGLADLWETAGHDLTRIGRGGGDVSQADAVVIAVPGGAVKDALDGVQGVDGKITIDATNLVGTTPPDGFGSNAEFVKSRTGGPQRSLSTSTSRPFTTRSPAPGSGRATSGVATRRPGASSSS